MSAATREALDEAGRERILRQVAEQLERINAARVARGTCRHCDGAVPCWSEFGDRAVGKKHTVASWRKRRERGL